MDHNKQHDLHEFAHVSDEALEDVSGGIFETAYNFICPICKKNYPTSAKAIYRTMTVCKVCKKKLEDQPVNI